MQPTKSRCSTESVDDSVYASRSDFKRESLHLHRIVEGILLVASQCFQQSVLFVRDKGLEQGPLTYPVMCGQLL
jgi:hypothetical protein